MTDEVVSRKTALEEIADFQLGVGFGEASTQPFYQYLRRQTEMMEFLLPARPPRQRNMPRGLGGEREAVARRQAVAPERRAAVARLHRERARTSSSAHSETPWTITTRSESGGFGG